MAVLKIGSRGAAVTALKRRLAKQGYWPDGYGYSENFTKRVADIVQVFQGQHIDEHGEWLDADGIVGPKTDWALRYAYGPPQSMHVMPEITITVNLRDLLPETVMQQKRARFVQEALSWHNVRERPNGSNRGPKVDLLVPSWARPASGKGYPWCCFSVWAWFKKAFDEWPLGDNQHRGGVASAKAYASGKRRFIPKVGSRTPCPGDALVMLYRRDGKLTGKGHIAVVLSNAMRWSSAANAQRRVFTVGGNEGNRVKIGKRTLEDPTVVGWIDFFGDSREQSGSPWTFRDYQVDGAGSLTQGNTR